MSIKINCIVNFVSESAINENKHYQENSYESVILHE